MRTALLSASQLPSLRAWRALYDAAQNAQSLDLRRYKASTLTCMKTAAPTHGAASTNAQLSMAESLNTALEVPTSAYVHLPFCKRKCFYCDFPVVATGSQLGSAPVQGAMQVRFATKQTFQRCSKSSQQQRCLLRTTLNGGAVVAVYWVPELPDKRADTAAGVRGPAVPGGCRNAAGWRRAAAHGVLRRRHAVARITHPGPLHAPPPQHQAVFSKRLSALHLSQVLHKLQFGPSLQAPMARLPSVKPIYDDCFFICYV